MHFIPFQHAYTLAYHLTNCHPVFFHPKAAPKSPLEFALCQPKAFASHILLFEASTRHHPPPHIIVCGHVNYGKYFSKRGRLSHRDKESLMSEMFLVLPSSRLFILWTVLVRSSEAISCIGQFTGRKSVTTLQHQNPNTQGLVTKIKNGNSVPTTSGFKNKFSLKKRSAMDNLLQQIHFQ